MGTSGTPPSTGSLCSKSLEGASSVALASSRARFPCPPDSAENPHADQLIAAPTRSLRDCSFCTPAEVEFWVCSPPARPKMVISFILALALMLERLIIRLGWYLLHRSSNMTSAVQLFPWDPGGQEDIAAVQIYILVSSLFSILVFNNKGKPRCKRLNPRSRHIKSAAIIQLEDELGLRERGRCHGHAEGCRRARVS
jgi:hypothetical protein